jgi:hypothetical protein
MVMKIKYEWQEKSIFDKNKHNCLIVFVEVAKVMIVFIGKKSMYYIFELIYSDFQWILIGTSR